MSKEINPSKRVATMIMLTDTGYLTENLVMAFNISAVLINYLRIFTRD